MLLPSGTVTFLFTDIEGSTKIWEKHPEEMRPALARHDALLRQAIEENNGYVFKTIGDAFCAAFATALDALNAALAAQRALHCEPWPSPLVLRVRMVLHTGAAELRDNDYFGQPLNRLARLLDVAHGRQVLLSDAAHNLTRDTLPPSVRLKSLGEHRLRDLGRPETVFQLLHPDLTSEFPPLRSLASIPNNLPQQVTSFIGRKKEMAEVKTLQGKTRLLTLTGSGGCGKTRLALQVAAAILENYPDGAWFVELAPLADPALVPQTLAQALSVTEEPGKPLVQTLVAALKTQRMLLILDNCEHLIAACAHLVDTLLRACPGVCVLASSREGLGTAGELTYRIPSLSVPDLKQTALLESVSQYESVQLFIERALFHLPAFAVTNQNAPALASVCHRLDGIPLAIELAAARVRALSVEEIDNKLDDRFRLLIGGSRTALARQQTLRALIDWSYDLLNVQEKTLLRRLSVFAGGWTLQAAEQVGAGESVTDARIETWETLDLLTSLADKSLVLAQTQGKSTRYTLLETMRQYARDRLVESGESCAVRTRHGDYFLRLAEEVTPKLRGPEQAQSLGILEEEHDNLRQAMTLYGEDAEDTEAGAKGLRLGTTLQPFWWTRGHLSEGRKRSLTLLAHPKWQEATKARGDLLNGAGVLTYMQGDYTQARVLLKESLAIGRGLEDRRSIAIPLNNLGAVAFEQGDYAVARVYYEESLVIARELGESRSIAISLNNLGAVAHEQGDYAVARGLLEESLAIARELEDKGLIASTLHNLGNVTAEQGDYDGTRVLYKESLAIARERGDRQGIARDFEAFASLAFKEAQTLRCACLRGAAEVLRETIGSPLTPTEREEQEREAATVRQTLGEEAFAAAWAQGRAMTMEQTVAYAREQVAS